MTEYINRFEESDKRCRVAQALCQPINHLQRREIYAENYDESMAFSLERSGIYVFAEMVIMKRNLGQP